MQAWVSQKGRKANTNCVGQAVYQVFAKFLIMETAKTSKGKLRFRKKSRTSEG